MLINLAAVALLTDYSKLPREDRNILRLMFSGDHVRVRNDDWSSVARFVVGAFWVDVARLGATTSAEVRKLVAELCRISPEFEALWQDNEVVAHGEGVKRINHPEAGLLAMEFSSFAVGRPARAWDDRLQPRLRRRRRAAPRAYRFQRSRT